MSQTMWQTVSVFAAIVTAILIFDFIRTGYRNGRARYLERERQRR